MSGLHAVARKVAAGTASNAGGRAVILISRILVTPVIVHAVGATDYGVWVLVASIATVGGVLELGISAGLVKYVAEHSARDEATEAAHIVSAATWLYRALALFFVVTGAALALGVPAILDLDGHIESVAQALGVVAAVDLGLSMLPLAPQSVLKGLQRFPLVNAVQAGAAVLGAVLSVIVVVAGAGIVAVSAAWALATGISAVAFAVAARRAAPTYMTLPGRFDRERVRRLIRFSRSIAAVQVAVNLQSRLDVVVIAAALPVRNVTPYSFAQRLADGTRIATDQFGKVLLPLASEVSATRERAAVGELFLTSTRLTMLIALGVGLPVALLGGPILEVWVGDEFAGYGALVAILACAAIVDLPSYPAAAVLQSLERHGPVAWMAMGSAIANVALSVALVGPYGVEGVALGTLIAGGIEVLLLVVPYAARVLGLSAWTVVSNAFGPLVVPSAALALALLGGDALLPVTNLVGLLVVIGCAMAIYAAVYALITAPARERELYRAAARALVPGRGDRVRSWPR
jgi:O-antigen/teichoic acid export membrane protein